MKAVIAAFNQASLWNFKCHEVSFPALQPSVQFAELVTQCCHYHDAVPCPAPSAAPPTVIGSVIDKMAQLENSNDAMCALLGWVWGVCSIYSIYNISTIYLQSLEYLLWGVEVKQQAAATLLECPAWVEDDGDPHLFLFLFYDRGKDTGWAGLGRAHASFIFSTRSWRWHKAPVAAYRDHCEVTTRLWRPLIDCWPIMQPEIAWINNIFN